MRPGRSPHASGSRAKLKTLTGFSTRSNSKPRGTPSAYDLARPNLRPEGTRSVRRLLFAAAAVDEGRTYPRLQPRARTRTGRNLRSHLAHRTSLPPPRRFGCEDHRPGR